MTLTVWAPPRSALENCTCVYDFVLFLISFSRFLKLCLCIKAVSSVRKVKAGINADRGQRSSSIVDVCRLPENIRHWQQVLEEPLRVCGCKSKPLDNQVGALGCRDRRSESVISTATACCQSRNEFLPVVRPCAVKGIKRGAPVLLLGSVTILPENLKPPPL